MRDPLKPGDVVHLLSQIGMRPMVVVCQLPDTLTACQWIDKASGLDSYGKYTPSVLGREFIQWFNDVRVVRLEYPDGSCPEISETLTRKMPIIPLQVAPMTDAEWSHMMGDDIRTPPPANWTEMNTGDL